MANGAMYCHMTFYRGLNRLCTEWPVGIVVPLLGATVAVAMPWTVLHLPPLTRVVMLTR